MNRIKIDDIQVSVDVHCIVRYVLLCCMNGKNNWNKKMSNSYIKRINENQTLRAVFVIHEMLADLPVCSKTFQYR